MNTVFHFQTPALKIGWLFRKKNKRRNSSKEANEQKSQYRQAQLILHQSKNESTESSARFDLGTIEAGLSTLVIARGGHNELWQEIASTNDRSIQLAGQGAAEGVMVLARRQTNGRGRQGRSWVSPQDSGIFVSFILRPQLKPHQLPLISFAAGVAAAQAIDRVTGIKIGLKWVNDLVYNGKKLGGILAEVPGSQEKTEKAGDNGLLKPAVILGLGINLSLREDDVPDDLSGKVSCLDSLLGTQVNANQLISELCSTLEEQYNHLCCKGHELVLQQWKKHSATLGKRIKARAGNAELEGIACNLAESGALILRLDSGENCLLQAGEITIRLDDGSYA